MVKKIVCKVLVLCCVLLVGTRLDAKSHKLVSPDGKHSITFKLLDGELFYNVGYKSKTVLSDSKLSLSIEGHDDLSKNFKIENTSSSSKNDSWKPVVGSKSVYPENYNELFVQLVETRGDQRHLNLTFRAYNEGVAFRYEILLPDKLKNYTISSENSEFQFTGDHYVYFDDYPQADYEKVRLSAMPDNAIRPLLLETGSIYIAIAEAGSVEHYAPMKLSRSKTNCLITGFRSGKVKVGQSLTTPWRVIMVAEQPGTLVEHHYLLQNLSPENAIGDTGWIKPGKCWRSGLTTEEAKAIVDQEVKWNYQYVHFDAGWYGPERDKNSNPVKPIPGINITEVTRYAKAHGKGVICYINKIALSDYDMENTFKTYEKWGINGVKFGFVDWKSQDDMAFLYKAIRMAAKYHLIVDIHDNYRLTGIERTYPNLLTVEGILGNEEKTSNEPYNVLITSFARMIAGAGDFTPCYLNGRVISRSWQLALGVVFYSPLQYLHWYDGPQKYKGSYPELEFWQKMPTIWDDTKVLNGEVGEYMTVARKSGDAWFIGSLTNKARSMDIPLSFLDKGNYIATIYKESAADKKYVSIEMDNVNSSSTLKAVMSDGSGYAVWIQPVKNGDKQD